MTVHTFTLDPFDMLIHTTPEGVARLQSRFASWLRGLSGPARFLCWQVPADLDERIGQVARTAQTAVPPRSSLLMAYRRGYESLQRGSHYQRTTCGLMQWAADNPGALAGTLASAFDVRVTPGPLPALFQGQYVLRDRPLWHLAPIGRPGGRPVWSVLSSYECLPSTWNFFEPLPPLLQLGFPIALCVDIPRSYDRHSATDKIEAIILAYQTHLATSSGEDSRAVRRIQDCRRTLEQLNDGDALHEVQLIVAVPAHDTDTLRKRVARVVSELRPWIRMRPEVGELLSRAVKYFAPVPSKQLHMPTGTWPLTSSEAALALAPLGYRKLSHTDGVMRGEAVGGAYPVFHQSWRQEKQASHEVWVGVTGYGKTFGLNCYLSREYTEQAIPFDLLEPMGHGELLADAFEVDWFPLSQDTRLNPQDVMFPTLLEQVSHTIRIYETVMGRQLTGSQTANLERGLLAHALERVYEDRGELVTITPDRSPTCEDLIDVLSTLGEQPHIQKLARDLADELAALCTGSGPWAKFLNGQTTVDFGRSGRSAIGPRVFSFHRLENDPVMIALAYTQVLSAIRRDSLLDEQPRIIAVDEVYRLMRHPSLLDFLIEAAKTFRTRRKKLITIDQNMSIFLEGKARLIFENSPIRVIFNQRQGMHVFREDPAFSHLNERHLAIIAALPRYRFLFDVQDEGSWYLYSKPFDIEHELFATT